MEERADHRYRWIGDVVCFPSPHASATHQKPAYLTYVGDPQRQHGHGLGHRLTMLFILLTEARITGAFCTSCITLSCSAYAHALNLRSSPRTHCHSTAAGPESAVSDRRNKCFKILVEVIRRFAIARVRLDLIRHRAHTSSFAEKATACQNGRWRCGGCSVCI